MLKEIPVSKLQPNPFRRLDEYPIIRAKIDALKESFASTGFWGNIVARQVGEKYEIAYGHHRLVALQEQFGKAKRVEVIVRKLTNEQMIQIMARENMEEWGTSAWVELETIRSVIDAYGKGEIELPKVPKNTDSKLIRQAQQSSVELPYTRATVAAFLGWTRAEGKLPNYACEQAFRALDMIDGGFLREKDLRGLGRAQMAALIDGQYRIYIANKRQADAQFADAKRKEKQAASSSGVERERSERQAVFLRKQAEGTQKKGRLDAQQFAKDVAPKLRDNQASIRDIRQMADQRTAVPKSDKVHTADGLAEKIADQLDRLANGDDVVSATVGLLKGHAELSDRAARRLDKSIDNAIRRLEKLRAKFGLTSVV